MAEGGEAGIKVRFEDLLSQVLRATAKSHLDSFKCVKAFMEQEFMLNLEDRSYLYSVQHVMEMLIEFRKQGNYVRHEDLLYQLIIKAADQIMIGCLQSETFIWQGRRVELKDSWYQVLQEAAYRQLVIIVGVELFLETFTEGGKCCIILEDSPKDQNDKSNRELVSVRRLPLPVDTDIKQGMLVEFEDSFKAWRKRANSYLVSVKQVRQLLETFIAQEMLLNHYSWKLALREEFNKYYYTELSEFVSKERETEDVYPPEHQVFNWTKFCRANDVKVVILGQDPYKRPGQAHGLSFSVRQGVPLPPSLSNIYKKLKDELYRNYQGFERPGHGTLIGWAVQGVLLLNTCLTFRKDGNENAHKDKGWETFTSAVLKWLIKNQRGIIFMLWGKDAREMKVFKDNETTMTESKHKIIESSHPSPKSAYYSTKECKSFMEVSHFLECNTYLRQKGKTPIDWSWLPALEA